MATQELRASYTFSIWCNYILYQYMLAYIYDYIWYIRISKVDFSILHGHATTEGRAMGIRPLRRVLSSSGQLPWLRKCRQQSSAQSTKCQSTPWRPLCPHCPTLTASWGTSRGASSQ